MHFGGLLTAIDLTHPLSPSSFRAASSLAEALEVSKPIVAEQRPRLDPLDSVLLQLEATSLKTTYLRVSIRRYGFVWR